jgi:putative ABC transport system permease protein
VRGSRQTTLASPPDAEIYLLSFRQIPPGTIWAQFLLQQIMTYVVRTDRDPLAISSEVVRAIHTIDPVQTVFHMATMEEVVSSSVRGRRLGLILVAVFAGLALVVAAAGLYGVLSYLVSQRTRDIAVRLALGATREDVVRMIMSRALAVCGIGLSTGLFGAMWCGQVMAGMLADVRPWDPATLGVTSATLLLVAFAAAWFPGRRAASIDTCQALRTE